MLTPNKKVYYALEAVLYIAYNAKTGPVSGTALAAAQNLPTRYLEPLMQKLVRAGILKGQRGPTGGYMLGRERRRISLGHICAALNSSNTLPKTNTALGDEILAPCITLLSAGWRTQLGDVDLATLCEQAEKKQIPTDATPITDFTI